MDEEKFVLQEINHWLRNIQTLQWGVASVLISINLLSVYSAFEMVNNCNVLPMVIPALGALHFLFSGLGIWFIISLVVDNLRLIRKRFNANRDGLGKRCFEDNFKYNPKPAQHNILPLMMYLRKQCLLQNDCLAWA